MAFFFMPHIDLLPELLIGDAPFKMLLTEGIYNSYTRYKNSHDDESPEEFTANRDFNYDDIDDLLKEGEKIYEERHLAGTPSFSINESTFIYLQQHYENVGFTDDEKAYWMMFWAISSLIGTKPFVSTTKAEILSRMFGAATPEKLNKRLAESPELSAYYQRFGSRRFYERTLMNLQADCHIVEYGAFRRTHLALYQPHMTSPVQLAKLVNEKGRAARKQTINQQKAKARMLYRAPLDQ